MLEGRKENKNTRRCYALYRDKTIVEKGLNRTKNNASSGKGPLQVKSQGKRKGSSLKSMDFCLSFGECDGYVSKGKTFYKLQKARIIKGC